MRISLLILSAVACVTPALSRAQGSRAAAPDLILVGAKIFTANSAQPWAQAIAIRGNRIVAVGTTAEIRALAIETTRVVDLAGRTVIPGINDAHDHIGNGAQAAVIFRTTAARAANPLFAEVLDSLRALDARTEPGIWLMATIGPTVLYDTAAHRVTLDRAAPRHPVMLGTSTGHNLILNSAALRAAGISDSTRDPAGGWYGRDRNNYVNGGLNEYAVWSATRRIWSALPDSTLVEELSRYSSATLRFGITTVQDMASDWDPPTTIRIFHAAQLPFRVRIIRFSMTEATGRLVTEWEGVDLHPAPLTVVDGRKWILEGTGGERGALKRASYPGRPGWFGRFDFPADTVRAMLVEALNNHEQLMLHIGGDSAIKLVLGMMQSLAPDATWRALRVRFEHGDGMAPDLVPIAVRLGVIVVQNPTHFGAQPFLSLLRAGIPIAIGSDDARNPFLNIMLAVTREENPSEAISREEAVSAYTRGGAYAEFAEQDKGTLAPGMLADLAVLSQDIFTVPVSAMPATVSLLTIVGGKTVFDAHKIP